jgi:hypothetical protein
VRACLSLGVGMAAALVTGAGCEGSYLVPTVDPGPNYVLPTVQFSANYFFCVVEPEIIMGGLTKTPCGDNGSHGCHYSDKVPEMTIIPLPQPVKCSGSGTSAIPTDPTQIADGTPAQINLAQVSFQMSADYTNANIYLWPTQTIQGHPVQVFSPSDASVVDIIKTWSTTQ